MRRLDGPLADIGSVQGDHRTALLTAAERCVRDDGADVFILLARLWQGWPALSKMNCPCQSWMACPRPCAMPKSVVALRPRSPRSGSIAPPPLETNQGLPAAIKALLLSAGG
jgi:hypothetical protein